MTGSIQNLRYDCITTRSNRLGTIHPCDDVNHAEVDAAMTQPQAVGRWQSTQTLVRYVGAQFAARSVVAQLYSRKGKRKKKA